MTIGIKGFVVEIDVEDYDLAKDSGWCPSKHQGKVYFDRNRKVGNQLFHRLIMKAPRGMYVDHINGNTLDNRKINLRLATPTQSRFNSILGKRNKSGFRGISWDKERQLWNARIQINGTTFRLGRFKDKEEAYAAYQKKAKELAGEFAEIQRSDYGR